MSKHQLITSFSFEVEFQLLSRGRHGVDPASVSYIRFTAMNIEPSDGFCPPGSGHEPSTQLTPSPIPGCLPLPVLVLPFPCGLLSLP